MLEAHFALDGDRIREIVFAGDFIANSLAIERLERELRGAPAEAGAVEAVTRAIFGRPDNFLLRRALLKSQYLICLILGHRVRAAARASAPRVTLILRCRTPSGKPAVEICL